MSEVNQYAVRDLMAMDIAGNHYCRHVDHMTREQLHSKSDIAAELGWRDMQIAKLTAERDALAALTAQPVKLPKGFNPAIGDIFDKAAPVMRRDATDGKWLHKADVTKILNELGYEVQE